MYTWCTYCAIIAVFGWWDAVDGDGSITLSPVRRELERSDFYQITAGVIKGNAMTFIIGSVSVVLNSSVASATAGECCVTVPVRIGRSHCW